MNVKDKIIAEIDTLPDFLLKDILKQIENFKHQKSLPNIVINSNNNYPLKNSVIYYHDPFEPCTSLEDWDVLS